MINHKHSTENIGYFLRKVYTNQDIFQYTIQMEGTSFSCPWDKKTFFLSFYAFEVFLSMLLKYFQGPAI